MLHKLISAILLALLTVFIFLFFRTGAYKSSSVEVAPPPNLQLFYMIHEGPYHEIAEDLMAVEGAFKGLEIKCPKSFGLFLSDPETTDHEKLISHVGCAFKANESPQLFAPPNGILQSFFGQDFLNKDSLCVKGTFSGSPSLTALKVYSKLKSRAKKENISLKVPALEIYTVNPDQSVTTEVFLCGDKI